MSARFRAGTGEEPMAEIVIVGMACRYPDAATPAELWENVLAGRRAFRQLPDQRLPLADYWDPDPTVPDRFYARNAAVIEGYEFDRVGYKIAGHTYRSTDLTHWLALDVAATALADADFPQAEGLPRERTGVIIGNTMAGEFSRANGLRLRWPYVRRTVAAALQAEDWDRDRLAIFLDRLEADYKAPFPAPDEDSLAGGLSNTIAGRICNFFDLKGGGYTVDGACSSSLLSVVTGCTALVNGDLDVVVAGGVDLSIDPFEMIGFAKTGALAPVEMRVYDRGSSGFWPGEGCGMVVLMRRPDAEAGGHRILAGIPGWGISSDGRGGMTRPDVRGYRLALDRAYQRAGFGIDTVAMFEGHGTGTQVGDATELRALSGARLSADPQVGAAAISSIKGAIGHTKAAAGVAGLIKAVMAVHAEVLPPTVGCVDPHPVFADEARALRVLGQAEAWPSGAPVRAGVTAMGFGGINTHLVVENLAPRRQPLDRRTHALASSGQDAELLLVDGDSREDLLERLDYVAAAVAPLSYAQLGDLAATLAGQLRARPWRAAAVAANPAQAQRRLSQVRQALAAGQTTMIGSDGGFLGHAQGPGRVGFLFPGQGSGQGSGTGGALRRRFAAVDELCSRLAPAPVVGADPIATAVAQPRLVTGSAAGLAALQVLGLEAEVALGHSLGEISALYWAGAIDEPSLVRLATARGAIMSERSAAGTMAAVNAAPQVVTRLAEGLPVVIAGYNGPAQSVIAGSVEAIEAFGRRAVADRVPWRRLAVSHAFHSPLVAPAAEYFGTWLAQARFSPLDRRIFSTVTGGPLDPDVDLRSLLRRQITAPVLFASALELAAKEVDLFVEVGPGRVLSGLVAAQCDVPVVALDTDAEQIRGLLEVAAAAHVLGTGLRPAALFENRLIRPLDLDAPGRFFTSPCEIGAARYTAPPELAPLPGRSRESGASLEPQMVPDPGASPDPDRPVESSLELLRRLVAERAELPPEMVTGESRLLDSLHLSSITIGQIFTEVARQLQMPAIQAPADLATATVAELAEALDRAADTTIGADLAADPTGAAAWVRAFRVDLDPLPVPLRSAAPAVGTWTAYPPAGHWLTVPLLAELERAELGAGVLVCLPDGCAIDDLGPALAGAKAAASTGPGGRFVLVQGATGAAGLAKTLRQEAPHLNVTVVHVSPDTPADLAVEAVVAEVASTDGFTEIQLDAEAVRRVPVLRAMPVQPARTSAPLDRTDVLLVTGGGKGITAECALVLAGDHGSRLAILGRSDPNQDPELAANLRRMGDRGVRVSYRRADLGDAGQVRAALHSLTTELGPITAVLHGAGRNDPASLSGLSLDDFRDTFAPKVDGLTAVLGAIDPSRLRLMMAFGSIIGRSGLRGEAHYATANEWLAGLSDDFARRYPNCRTLCLEWSVWSGVGMGERLAVSESLAREGITPISPDQGIEILRRLVNDPDAPSTVVISGRTGRIDTVRRELPELPLLRFVDRTPVRYHGVELIAETDLNIGTDPYLSDHRLDEALLFPAVFGMEAMAQVGAAATGWTTVPVLEDVEFLRPVVVPPDGSVRIRIAATVTGVDILEVSLRSAQTDFAADHFRARLRYGVDDVPAGPPDQVDDGPGPVPLQPDRDLYGDLLFQGPRFQRLRRYHRVAARHVDADVAVGASGSWFAPFLPQRLVLGDPGARDALMHGTQVCVPDAILLPTGIGRLHPRGTPPEPAEAGATVRYCAAERARNGNSYVYDLAVRDGSGRVVERWTGLQLRTVRTSDGRGPWPAALLGPRLERRMDDLLGPGVAVAVEPDAPDPPDRPGEPGYQARRRARTAVAVSRAYGRDIPLRYRPDGRPEIGGAVVSASHGAGLTLAAVADRLVAVDVEPVAARPAQEWSGLLGRHASVAELLAEELGEGPDAAGTRLWAAAECLRKAGLPADAPLTPVTVPASDSPAGAPPWQIFSSGTLRIVTLVTSVQGVPGPVVFAILAERRTPA